MAKFLYRGIFYTVMGALVLVLSWTDVIAVRSRVAGITVASLTCA